MTDVAPVSVRWLADDLLTIGDLTFSTGVSDDGIAIVKPPELVRRYLDLLAAERPEVIVELGTKDGGSAALMLAAGLPELLLTIDLAEAVPSALVDLGDDPKLGPRLEARAGVDQADAAVLAATVDQARGARRIDLVVDDASHILGPSRVSFDVLFPRIRPGGLFLLEDWSSEAWVAAAVARAVPPSAPDHAERVALVRALVLQLNQPGFLPPAPLIEALADAHGRRRPIEPVPTGVGLTGMVAAIVDAAASADLDALREVALDELPRPLVDMAIELTLVAATRPDVVSSVEITSEWIAVRRGPATLPLDDFRLAALHHDAFGYLPG